MTIPQKTWSLCSRTSIFFIPLALTIACSAQPPKTTRAPSPQKASGSANAIDKRELVATPRISEPPPPPEDYPELPAGSENWSEITVAFVQRGPKGEALGQSVVSRARSRVHLALPRQQREWLFMQNPRDPRRASGKLIDHRRKVIVKYTESDLRIEGIARGWADIISIDAERGEILNRKADPQLLLDPEKRYPNYEYFEISDWREEVHEPGPDAGAAASHHHHP